jgi:hypothetical protein
MARLLPGHALINVVEANESQTGKGYLLTCEKAVYNEPGYDIAKRDGGVGSLDESLGAALFSGAPFITFDNLRGKVNSQYLESVVTAHGAVIVRLPHRGEVAVDAGRVTFHATSNGFESTVDLGNRSMVTGLLMQPPGYEFKRYPEGDLLAHIRARQPYYLGCVFAVVRSWHDEGKPRLPTRHRFAEWVGSLDWIVQRAFGLAPLLDGHGEVVSRVTNPGLSWLRAVAIAVVKAGRAGDELSASALVEVSENAELKIPGAEQLQVEEAARRVGALLAPCFKHGDSVQLDALQVRRIERREYSSARRENLPVKRYVFSAFAAGSGHGSEIDA